MKRILALLALFFFVSYSYASLIISPERIDLVVERNAVFEGDYSVTNGYDDSVDVEISYTNWQIYSGNGDLDINNWLKIPFSKIRLAKGETKKVPYEIHTSNSMKGSVSAQVSFSAKPPQSAGINVKMTFPLYLVIEGTQKIEFSVEKIIINQFQGNISADALIKNDGNVHIRPDGTLNIYSGKKLVYTVEIPDGFPVYAGTSRSVLRASIPNDLKTGKYVAEVVARALGMEARKKVEFRIRKDGSLIS
ncbi:MAG: hypothetical protein FWF00_05750 [Endomicrobia bacterium]|nr:hypothetical protein [Endomicrobiia bacterium]MCL2507172.1 hypothetical protein [Endomicrobiia bacterium]